jgi:pSer/pThr/pTyr-binding forkhead associated (FHA) protein
MASLGLGSQVSEVSLGRDPTCTVAIDNPVVSARHARIGKNIHPPGLFVEDLGSTNGTYLDRARITTPTPVPIGVPIRIGRTVLELRP